MTSDTDSIASMTGLASGSLKPSVSTRKEPPGNESFGNRRGVVVDETFLSSIHGGLEANNNAGRGQEEPTGNVIDENFASSMRNALTRNNNPDFASGYRNRDDNSVTSSIASSATRNAGNSGNTEMEKGLTKLSMENFADIIAQAFVSASRKPPSYAPTGATAPLFDSI